jgi:hypothetical protein
MAGPARAAWECCAPQIFERIDLVLPVDDVQRQAMVNIYEVETRAVGTLKPVQR